MENQSPKLTSTNSQFASKIGAVLAAAGSAVGLGNVWRFPTETGINGGAAFILIYIAFMILLGVPVMVTEFAIGRHGGSNVADSFRKLGGKHPAWRFMGLLPFVAGIIVLSYYAVVAGWTLYYAYLSLTGNMMGHDASHYISLFSEFSANPVASSLWTAIIILLTCGIVALGVRRGIERGAEILMPLLFIFVIFLAVCSMFLPGAKEGLTYLLKPDFSKVTSSVVLSAMGQAFFSLSVGIGCLCTYACYFRRDVNLIGDGVKIATIDSLVALCSGFIIFPAVFSIPGMTPDAGPSLVFITLPTVFQQVLGATPAIAYIFTLVFYLLLVMAALTSSISMLEMSTAFIKKSTKLSRPVSSLIVSCICIALGISCSLGFGIWKDVTIFGMTLFDLFDFIVAKFLMPIGAFIMCVFLGWVVDKNILRNELTNNGTLRQPLYQTYRFIIRYIAPICIALILADQWGIF